MSSSTDNRREDIAIIGMAGLFPGACNIEQYWQNILSKVDAIGDPPADWEAERYFDADSTGPDHIYCKRGGFLGELSRFDPLEFGVMPSTLDGGEPDHYLALKVAKDAMTDAGLSESNIDPERSAVIIGRGTYINRGLTSVFSHTVVIDQTLDIIRELHPEHTEEDLLELKKRLKASLPPFTPELAPSFVPNVLAGRIANRLNLMGASYIVDAACASSLVAVEHGMRDLIDGRCDVALVGGVNAAIPPPILFVFTLINALSRRQVLRPFDAMSDGTMLGEGLGFVVLKRRSDAERDGNRIYAVLKAVGIASDGRAMGLLTPRVEGEALAMKLAYEICGVAPETIGLLEAHGTGTPVGDVTEVEALRRVFGTRSEGRPSCAMGTVKSMIGHLIPASGMAALIKTSLALYHKVLPPTLCDTVNPSLGLESTLFYLNTELRPWIHGAGEHPRRAGINSFGFGGINAHAVLEEYRNEAVMNTHVAWSAEAFLFGAESRELLIAQMLQVRNYLSVHADASLKDIAYTLCKKLTGTVCRLSIVAGTAEDLIKKIEHAAKRLNDSACLRIRDRSGIYFFEQPLGHDGKVAFLFPGEGSQYPGMLADLCLHFPEARSAFDEMDRAFIQHHRGYLPSHAVFPLPLNQESVNRLWEMDSAAESVSAANQALLNIMQGLQIVPDVLLGHSTGEYSALLAGGIVNAEPKSRYLDYVLGVNTVYERVAQAGQIAEGILLSVGAARPELINDLISQSQGNLFLAMDNCTNQRVLYGTESVIAAAEEKLRADGALVERLPFSRAYHTPLFEPMSEALLEYFENLDIQAPRIRTYSCVSVGPYPDLPDAIRRLATSQWSRQVRFKECIEALYEEGVRIFIEVGPRGNLTAFVDDILRKRPYLAIPSNLQKLSGIVQLAHLTGLLSAHHVSFDPTFLYSRRVPHEIDFGAIPVPKRDRSSKIHLALTRLRLDGFRLPQHAVPGGRVVCDEMAVNSGVAPASKPDMRAEAMRAYFHNMEQFLTIQNGLYSSLLSARKSSAQPATSAVAVVPCDKPAQSAAVLPFLRTIVSCEPGKEAVVLCRLSLNEDLFLRDHVLGGTVSAVDQDLTSFPVVPLTFSTEIMAEVAALIFPGMKLVGMREIRAYRWVGLDERERTIRITATVQPTSGREVAVSVREADTDGHAGPFVEGTMVFAADYSAAPPVGPFAPVGSRASRWSAQPLYGSYMFHGPMLQGVASVDQWGEDGITAVVQGMPVNHFFRSCSSPTFMSDAATLDAAGQVVAYWISDHLKTGYHIFPFRLEALHLFGPPLRPAEKAECRARIELTDNGMMRSDIDIVASDGSLRMQLIGWWDRRFDLPEDFLLFRNNPCTTMVSREWTPARALFPNNSGVCCTLNGLSEEFLSASDGVWLRVLAHLVLSRAERDAWKQEKRTSKRSVEWLLGRTVLKDAVRVLMKKKHGFDMCPADIEVRTDEYGKPSVLLHGRPGIAAPAVSLAHADGSVMAVAVDEARGVGIDCEPVRSLQEGFDDVAFGVDEISLLPFDSDADRLAWRLRFWCAKESVAKLIGRGLMGTPKNLAIMAVDTATGSVTVKPAGPLAELRGGELFRCTTFQDDASIIAISYTL